MTLSVTIDRAALSLGALVIDADHASGLWLPEEGFRRPGKAWQRTTVSSPFTHGTVQTQARLEHASLQFTVYAQGATAAGLAARQDELEAALFQWSFDVTVTEDGQALTYTADCGDVSWNEADSGMTRAHLARATVTIPVYPVGA